jgi:hypothetical protein
MKKELVNLIFNGAALPPNAETADILLKSANDGRITIKVRERIDNDLLDSVRSLARDLFETTALGESEDDIADNLRREIDAKLEATNSYLAKYSYASYPGKPVIEAITASLRELKQIRDTKELFDSLSAWQSDLRATFSNLSPVQSFFDNQVTIFDRAVNAVKDYEMVSMSITVTANEVDSIREIVAKDEPYSDIPRLPALTSALEKATKEGRSELEKRAAEARKLEEDRRKAEAERKQAEAEGKTPAETPRVAKPVRSGDLINRTYSIKSEADVDAMLSELRVRLLQELADNGEVKVI